jgi:SAM-dependent methyltransferase
MSRRGDQLAYWDTVGASKTFTHPVQLDWLADVERDVRVLDYGCGYGRVLAELADRGFSRLSGVDVSPALIARARRLRPDLHVEHLASPPALPAGFGRFGVVLLIAVLTCVVEDDAQHELVAEVTRALAPGGLLYVSDLPLQDDEGHRDRYASHARLVDAPYGVFATGDGAVCRHHDRAHLHSLLAHLQVVEQREVDVVTMNGHRARAVQLLLRKA